MTAQHQRQPNPTTGGSRDDVEITDPTPTRTRAAITELFAAIDALVRSYQSMPDEEREVRLAADADLITGEIARRLAIARAEMSHAFPHLRM
jgi:hypothetical protein